MGGKKVSTITNFFKSFLVERKDIVVSEKVITIPNMITIAGILLTFLYVFMFTTGTQETYIPIILFLAISSDLLDGLAARKLEQHSLLGKELDPFRDRLLILAVMGNILYVSFTPLVGILSFILISLEIKAKILKNKQGYGPVHTVRKIRAAIHMACGIIFAIDYYWMSQSIEVIYLMFIMIISTIMAIFSYKK